MTKGTSAPKRNKFGAKRVFEDGYLFLSKAEHRRYRELRLAQAGKAISRLEVHPRYPIRWPGTDAKICIVELDFRYQRKEDNKLIVEDVKGQDTALSKLKRKLVQAAHGIEVELIRY